jgi:hypothetical protein
LTENRVFTVSSVGSVGVLTVHREQVPVDEVMVLTMLEAPTGRLAPTVTSNDTVAELLPATVTSWAQVLPAPLALHVQPSVAGPKVVLGGTVSISVVVPGLPPLKSVSVLAVKP